MRDKTLTFKISDEELEKLKKASEIRSLTTGSFSRMTAIDEANKILEVIR